MSKNLKLQPITYILASEPGTSPLASGYKEIGLVKGRSWSCPFRPRDDKHPTENKKLFCIRECSPKGKENELPDNKR